MIFQGLHVPCWPSAAYSNLEEKTIFFQPITVDKTPPPSPSPSAQMFSPALLLGHYRQVHRLLAMNAEIVQNCETQTNYSCWELAESSGQLREVSDCLQRSREYRRR